MRATTIRFPKDLWAQLEREAKKQGVSVAQYVRDAALYRVVFSAAASETNSHGERGAGLPPARARPE